MLKKRLRRLLASLGYLISPFHLQGDYLPERPDNEQATIYTPEETAVPAGAVVCLCNSVEREAIVAELERLAQSYSRRIFEWVCVFAKNLVSLGYHRISLIPHTDVRERGSRFVSTGVDPSFILRSAQKRLPSGWVLVTYRWHSRVSSRPKLYYDDGSGMVESNHAELLGLREGYVTTLVRLPTSTSMLRLDPFESEGDFLLDNLVMEEVRFLPRGELDQLKKRLLFVSPHYNLYLRSIVDESLASSTYQRWIHIDEPQQLPTTLKVSGEGPCVSLLMPVYNTDLYYLEAAIESVRRQTYANWQLCVVNDDSSDPGIMELLNSYARLDERIEVYHRQARGHISAASNDALSIARGAYCGLLDHDDLLTAQALGIVIEEIQQYPNVKVIYSDEDKLLPGVYSSTLPKMSPPPEDRRFDPYFKPDWDSELLLTQNFVSHFGVYETQLLRSVGGFRLGLEGAQDWDLVLRCTELIPDECIRHIPQILYHWRAAKGSLALHPLEKPYAARAGQTAVNDALERREVDALIVSHPELEGAFRVCYKVPEEVSVKIIIPTRDNPNLLRNCIDSVRSNTSIRSFEIVVVDNGSTLIETHQLLKSLSAGGIAILRYDQEFNFSGMVNFAIREYLADVYVLLNDDTIVEEPQWLAELVAQASRAEVGAVGCKLIYPNGVIQHAGIILGVGGVATHAFNGLHSSCSGYKNRSRLVQQYSAVTAACMAFRRDVWAEVGGFDDVNLPEAFNDVDFCLRVKDAGYKIIYTPFATVCHLESQSMGKISNRSAAQRERFTRATAYMQLRWGKQLKSDPAYHPFFNRQAADFGLAVSMDLGELERQGSS